MKEPEEGKKVFQASDSVPGVEYDTGRRWHHCGSCGMLREYKNTGHTNQSVDPPKEIWACIHCGYWNWWRDP